MQPSQSLQAHETRREKVFRLHALLHQDRSRVVLRQVQYAGVKWEEGGQVATRLTEGLEVFDGHKLGLLS